MQPHSASSVAACTVKLIPNDLPGRRAAEQVSVLMNADVRPLGGKVEIVGHDLPVETIAAILNVLTALEPEDVEYEMKICGS